MVVFLLAELDIPGLLVALLPLVLTDPPGLAPADVEYEYVCVA